jgi:hypothetical protein
MELEIFKTARVYPQNPLPVNCGHGGVHLRAENWKNGHLLHSVLEVNNHRQRRWLGGEAPIRGLKTLLILLCSDHSKPYVLTAFHPAFLHQ